MKKEKATEAAPKTSQNYTDNSASAQRAMLLAALRSLGPTGVTTIEAREQLDVMQPAPRIFELRHWFDLNILTIWTTSINAQGKKHRNARYVLMSEGGAV